LAEARSTPDAAEGAAAETTAFGEARYFNPKTDRVKFDKTKPVYDVFVSHAGPQKRGDVSHLVERLKDWGLSVFVDYDMTLGTPSTSAMIHAANHARVGLFFLSNDFFDEDREWTHKELLIFLARHKEDPQTTHIVPLFFNVGPGSKNADKLPLFGKDLLNRVSGIAGAEKFAGVTFDAELFEKVAMVVAQLADSPLVTYLSKGSEPLPEGAPPSAFLNARYEVVPFIFSDALKVFMAKFTVWCTKPTVPIALQIVHGSGGAGKTRTMVELIKRLRTKCRAGFLPKGTSIEKFEKMLSGSVNRHTVIVIDYAESWPNLRDFLQVLMNFNETVRSGFLRIILLSRNAGDWVKLLKTADVRFGTLLADSCILPFPSLPEADRRGMFVAAMHAYKKRFGSKVVKIEPSLVGDAFRSVLYVHMAALAAYNGIAFTTSDELLEEILNHEERFWGAEMRQQYERKADWDVERYKSKLHLLVAAITLRGGSRTETALESLVHSLQLDSILGDVAPLLRRLYPSSTLHVAPVEPDILGEGLVFRALSAKEDTNKYLSQIFEDKEESALSTAFALLGRLSADKSAAEKWITQLLQQDVQGHALMALVTALSMIDSKHADTLTKSPHNRIGSALAKSLIKVGTFEIAQYIIARVPKDSVSLRELAHWAAQKRVDHFRSNSGGSSNELAAALITLSNWQHNIGQRESALQSTQEAVKIRRQLAKDRPDSFLPDLAMSLSNLGSDQSALGQREAALLSTREAVKIRRQLAKDRPNASLPDLAESLNNLGGMQSALGQLEAALQSTQEAVNIRRQLAKDRPDAFLPYLARSLNNLGIRQSDLGQREAALTSTQEAVEIYRRLAKDRPDAFLPDLAASLNNLGSRQSVLGQRESAFQSTQEAVEIRRRLAKDRPDAFLPDLAMSLNNLGSDQSDLGQREAALQSTQEAVKIRRQLAKDRPDAFLPNLATSLNNLGIRYNALGQREAALQSAQEAVEIRRQLANDRPDAFLADLAESLGNLSIFLTEDGQFESAIATATECVEKFEGLARRYPAVFADKLEKSREILQQARESVGVPV